MKILYIVDGKLNVNHWSGTTKAIFDHLCMHASVDLLEIPITGIRHFKNRVINKLNSGVSFAERSDDNQRYRRKQIEKKLHEHSYNAIFCVGSLVAASIPDHINIPVFIYIDGVMSLMKGYYWKNVNEREFKKADIQEQKALLKAVQTGGMIFVASEWVKNGCIKDYDIPEKSISVVKIGANNLPELSEKMISAFSEKCCESFKKQIVLLFVGYDWKRKGLLEAFDLVRIIKNDYPVKLIVVGCTPSVPSDLLDNVEIVRKLDKSNSDDINKMVKLYCNSHFLIFPTHAECVGAVICEASSYGLPVLVNETGGTSSLVENGVNGFLLHLTMQDWAEKIVYYSDNIQLYKELRTTTYKYYQKELNWNSICNRMYSIIETICS